MPAESRRHDDNPSQLSPAMELDAFDFDETMPNIVDVDGRLAADTVAGANDTGIVPFMLGDYSEKVHFLPSMSVVRNEILEGVALSSIDEGKAAETTTDSKQICMAFRCVYCKDSKKRADEAVIHPQNLATIRDSFIHFQNTHVQQCTFIPSDIRDTYFAFKAQEQRQQEYDHPHTWASSAMRRGLRDGDEGGIIYCPELVETKEEILEAGHDIGEPGEVMNLFKEELGEFMVLVDTMEPSVPQSENKAVENNDADPTSLSVLDKDDLKILEELVFNENEEKKKKKEKAKYIPSQYTGVKSRRTGSLFEARFSTNRLGSYVLESDAAVAYDGFVRKSGRKGHFSKINFASQQDYMDAREKELDVRGLDVDFYKTLAVIESRVEDAASKMACAATPSDAYSGPPTTAPTSYALRSMDAGTIDEGVIGWKGKKKSNGGSRKKKQKEQNIIEDVGTIDEGSRFKAPKSSAGKRKKKRRGKRERYDEPAADSSSSKKQKTTRGKAGVGTKKTNMEAKEESKDKENIGRWTKEEHQLFLHGLEMHGNDYQKIAALVKSRSSLQVRTHKQKYIQKRYKEIMAEK